MSHPDLLLVSITRALLEVALFSLLGRGAVALLAGARRESNAIYLLFVVVTRPAVRFVRCLTPPAIADRHLPWLTFCLVFGLWILLAYVKRTLCAWHGLAGC